MTQDGNGARPRLRATTILGVRRDGNVALAGDGQVTIGEVVLKHGARKIRTLNDGQVLAGFAGAVADALTLFEKFEAQLKAWDGNLRRASVELTKEWRTDRYLRRLEAQLLVADLESILLLSGEGDVIEPDDGIAAIGSGAPYATAAAKALAGFTGMSAKEIAEAGMKIAADLCIYTNHHFTVEWVDAGDPTVHTETGATANVEQTVPSDPVPTDPAVSEPDSAQSEPAPTETPESAPSEAVPTKPEVEPEHD